MKWSAPAAALLAAATAVGAAAGCDRADPEARDASAPASAPTPTPHVTALVETPLVIGHRGAAGYRPEHTLESYEVASRMGADFIEADLVSTKDHVLVARHENDITETTNVEDHPEFAARRTSKTVDGELITGWFTEDFTLKELRTLRAEERLPQVRPKNTAYDGRFAIPTFDEVLSLRARLATELGRPIGIAPEIKHPTYFKSVNLPLESALVRQLESAGLNSADAPVLVQSFELTSLVALRRSLGLEAREVLLAKASGAPYDLRAAGDGRTFKELLAPSGLASLAKDGINAIGPEKSQVIRRAPDGTLGQPTSLVADAHTAGLQVLPYTFRAENQYLPMDFQKGPNAYAPGQAVEEQVAFLKAGIDGFFTDQADLGVQARRAFLTGRG